MKIYTRIEINMETMSVMHEESFEYDGIVSLCGGGSGGGSSTTNTVDYAYNARMATLSEEQQGWARSYYDMWNEYTKPYEIAQAQTNIGNLPLETGLYRQSLTAAEGLLPYQTNLQKQSLTSAMSLLPQQTEAAQKYLDASTKGVDVNERMALATADTANAFKDTTAANSRAAARLGVNPNSGRYQGIMAAQQTTQAAQLAGARTQARVGAEAENYDRLKNAASYNAGGILQGATTSAGNIMQGLNMLKS